MKIIEQIRDRLEALRRREIALAISGAARDGYSFNPRLTEREASAFERKHKISLPADYRAFLMELGDGGGVGPFNGIFPLGMMDGEPWPKWFVGKLSAPFPHRKTWNPAAVDEDADDWEEGDAEDMSQYDSANMAGAFPICDHGCAAWSWLVVSGRERGRVWFDGRGEGAGVYPEVDPDGKHLTFGKWYLTWIEERMAELRRAKRRKR